ncbi:MAG: biopolymer transporter ExbD [Phycisphaerae bacterium]
MARRGIEPMAEEHVNVTPLIDVVMCLIIFFMVCGKLAKTESEGNIKVPVARNGMEIREQRDRLVINLVPYDGAIPVGIDAKDKKKVDEFIGNQPPKWFIRGKEVEGNDLVDRLRREAKDNQDLKVMVRADQAQHYMYVVPILVACAKANIKSVNFSTTSLN